MNYLSRIFDFDLRSMLIALPAIIVSLSFHEAAHAYAAYRCGDPTAKNLGRLTLNPLKHIDPVGFFMLLFVKFGYAKPVPVNPNNFRRGVRDDFFVSIAGIATNVLLCVVFSAIWVLIFIVAYNNNIPLYDGSPIMVAYEMVAAFVTMNLSLAIFNFLPIPPLDGYHIFSDVIFRKQRYLSGLSAGAGQALLLVLIVTGVTGRIINYVFSHYIDLLNMIVNKILS